MPGEADRLKKEIGVLREQHLWSESILRMQMQARIKELEAEIAGSDGFEADCGRLATENIRLRRRIEELEGRLDAREEKIPKEDPLRYCDNLAARIEMLKADLGSLASREDQRAEALRVQMLGVMGRLDEVAAAYDAWDLMRDNHTSRLGSLERQVHELTIEVGRLRNDGRRWWQR